MKYNNTKEDFEIVRANAKEEFDVIRVLFRAYQKELGVDLTFQRFERELQQLPKIYTESNGALLLLNDLKDNKYVGCVGLKNLENGISEMKRLYVEPEYRDKKYGLQLALSIITVAIELGYKEMWLDTLEELKPAINLYKKLGFSETAPYYDNPNEGVVYMRKKLDWNIPNL